MQNDVIWAPWRLSYIVGTDSNPAEPAPVTVRPGGDPDCFLCRCASGDDRRQLWIVDRGDACMTVMNCFPYNNGHLLVAPLRHTASLVDLTPAEDAAITAEIKRMIGLLQRVLHPEGFNVGLNLGRAAGAGVPGHLHWHIIPRWVGDTNTMSTIGGVRVIPQSLEALWDALRSELTKG